MFAKYNGVMRGLMAGVPVLTEWFERQCQGNLYTTTISVAVSAIVKLGAINPVGLVYRAPGGAFPVPSLYLPCTFW
jgi:hypothetical protein